MDSINRAKHERDDFLLQRNHQIEKVLANLGEGFGTDEDIHGELNNPKIGLKDHRIDSYSLPSSEHTLGNGQL